MLRNRHGDACPDGDWHPPLAWTPCRGCQPCTAIHCRRCGTAHVDDAGRACAGCIADVREDLTEITAMCASLRSEARTKGIDSEAFNLIGPVPDPEARRHAEASYKAGRLPEGWLETGRHGKNCPLLRNEACTGCGSAGEAEHHPLTFAWWWNECWREAFDHDETPAVSRWIEERGQLVYVDAVYLVAYLDRNLAYAAEQVDLAFEDFARDAAACRRHLERVLHDGDQVETGAPCMTCRVPLQLVRTKSEDRWTCPRCHQESSDAQYRFAVQHLHRENAAWLTDREMELRTGVRAGTVREWARREVVGRRRDSGRTVYAVADVERAAREKGMMSA